MERLELGYNDLEEDYKEIFLDVACILKGWGKEKAIIALESRGFRARIGLRVLEQKSLITISKYEVLGMHDHLEEMGRNIVCRSHPDEHNKHSRLWIREEIEHILVNDLGTRETKCLRFSSPDFSAEIAIKGLAKLKDLRFIHIHREKENNLLNLTFDIVQLFEFDKVSQYLPNSLQFMRWYYFPFSSLPNTFQGENLVGLEMGGSKIVQLWEDAEEKVLHKLRFLTIWKSKLKTFDLKLAPNLEQLTICSCYDFREFHIPADHHSKLERLDLKYCRNLVEFQMPSESLNLEHLDLSHSKLKTIHLGSTPNLKKIILQGCNGLVLLPELGRVKCLKELNINRTGIHRLPQSIFQMKGLRIIGSTEIFESYGLTYKIQTSSEGYYFKETICYV